MEGWFVISGANRGLGQAIVRALLEEGASVVALHRCMEAPFPDIPPNSRMLSYRLDLRDSGAIFQFGHWLNEQGLPISCLINNAGVCLDGKGSFLLREAGFLQLAASDLEDTFRTNVFAPIHLVQAIHPSLVKGGLVLNMTSAMAFPEGLGPGWLAYRASKAALGMVTRVLGMELKDKGIHVHALHPGWVRTAMGGMEAPIEPHAAARSILGVVGRILAGDGNYESVLSLEY